MTPFHALFTPDARTLTIQNQDRLRSLALIVQQQLGFAARTILCFHDQYASARAIAAWNVVFLSEEVLRAPDRAVLTVALHEHIHLLLGRPLRSGISALHSDVDDLLHAHVIPGWLAGESAIDFDDDYISSKDWRQLYRPGWIRPTDVTMAAIQQTLDSYFAELKLDPWLPHVRRPVEGRVNSLAQRFRESREETARGLVTGYVLADYLHECESSSVSIAQRVDVSTVEEGHANLISALLTGIEFDELQRWLTKIP